MAKQTRYYHLHPRGFANECSVLVAHTAEEVALAERMAYHELTLDELREHVAWVNAENAAWGSGRAFKHRSLKLVIEDGEDAMAQAMYYEDTYPAAAEDAAR